MSQTAEESESGRKGLQISKNIHDVNRKLYNMFYVGFESGFTVACQRHQDRLITRSGSYIKDLFTDLTKLHHVLGIES